MKEIGGYIELDQYHLPMLHEGAIALNCGRNALAYVLKTKKIKKILLPVFMCNSVADVCKREGVLYRFYHTGLDFKPVSLETNEDEWLYLVNYYGQLTNRQIVEYKDRYKNIIVDNVQSYFQMPVDGLDTLYTCRKYFGVSDGAFLYTNLYFGEDLEQDESFDRMRFLLGRFERRASEFYEEYVKNDELFKHEPVKRMSRLTDNLLRGIHYEEVEKKRKTNFHYLHDELESINRIQITETGTFMYPLMVEKGAEVRKKLQGKKIYIPTLWPDVFQMCEEEETEYQMARDILPLPIDQRYSMGDMEIIVKAIRECIKM